MFYYQRIDQIPKALSLLLQGTFISHAETSQCSINHSLFCWIL